MKTVYICGDSFSTPDPEYGPCWVDMLEAHLALQARVINLSSVSASNLLISLQVKRAIENLADFVIFHATTVTRGEIVVNDQTTGDLLDRFNQQNLISYSIFRPYRSALDAQQQKQIQNFHGQYFDLDLAIHRDHCIIESSLHRLKDSGIPFLFDQGGFEHAKFVKTYKNYFESWQNYRSAVNLWDYSDTVDERPYFHIRDQHIHHEVAEYYAKEFSRLTK